MLKKRLLLSAAAGIMFAAPAFADGGPVAEPTPPSPPPPPPAEEEYTPPPPPPEAAPSVWYAALHGGVVWLGDIEMDQPGDPIGSELDTGWAAGGALGHRFSGTGFRAEIEGTYRRNDGTAFLILNPLQNAPFEVSSLSLMLNGVYDFDMGGFFRPYIGAGVGASHVNFDIVGEAEDDSWAFAWQFIGGFSVPMPNSAFEFFADYRYLSTAGLDIDFGGDIQDHDEYESHTVLGGVRFNF